MSNYETGAAGPPVAEQLSRLHKKDRRHYATGDHTHNGVNSRSLPQESLPYSAAKLSKDSLQTIVNTTEVQIGFGVIDFEIGDAVSARSLFNNDLLIHLAGLYSVKYSMRFANGVDGTVRKGFLYVNSTLVDISLCYDPSDGFNGSNVVKGSIDLVLQPNDSISLHGYHANGSGLDVTNLNGGTWLSATLIGLI